MVADASGAVGPGRPYASPTGRAPAAPALVPGSAVPGPEPGCRGIRPRPAGPASEAGCPTVAFGPGLPEGRITVSAAASGMSSASEPGDVGASAAVSRARPAFGSSGPLTVGFSGADGPAD